MPEPTNLRRLKTEITRRWGIVHLLDMLKEADLRIGLTREFTSVASHEAIARETLQERLLLVLFGYGTNTGLRRIAQGEHGHDVDALRYVRLRFLSAEAVRRAAAAIANATFAAREQPLWGEGTTACASDSKQVSAWDQNLLTEHHVRYHGRGIMIYWHVERGSMAIYSQLKNVSGSEVHAMIEGGWSGTPRPCGSRTTSIPTVSPKSGLRSPGCSASTCCPGSSGSTSRSCTGRPSASPTPTPT